ncbi:MerC domain-containing protein [Mycobacterium hodleri]|uniref:MerC domain-containing protein n=1 Tax=Mycolicibacterium hodleri TaxID=49897 RepID=A0A544W646_9MYCO|nr:MerC domain-containing protein [Mycolicibacterium hodleri]TQR87726.1 MerC domain-containing protein [Mycolicibacterium hodleri]
MSESPTPNIARAATALPPRWQRWLPRGAALVAAFATLCCLGLTAVVSLLTAIGATFLTTDATLKPLLVVSLVITIVASGFTWRRHRNPLPLLLTVIAAGVIFWSLYGTQLFSHHASSHGDAMNDPMGDGMGAHSAPAILPGGVGVWFGLALLLTAQLWDVWRLRQLKRQHACTA